MQEKIKRHLSKDPVLGRIIQEMPDPVYSQRKGVYAGLLGSIISQQLNVKVASIIQQQFLELFPERNPSPEALLALEMETLRAVGLSKQKALYMKNVAEFAIRENLVNKDFTAMDEEAVIKYLTQIKGVGKWTVEMILMFTLNRPDILPLDDYGIQVAMMKLYGIDGKGKVLNQKLLNVAEQWRPYRTYACYYLWKYKDQ